MRLYNSREMIHCCWVMLNSRWPLAEIFVLQGVPGGLHYFHISNSLWALQQRWGRLWYQADLLHTAGLNAFPQIWPITTPGSEKKAEPKDCRYRAERYGFHGKARNIKHKRSKIRAMMRKNLSDWTRMGKVWLFFFAHVKTETLEP